MDEKLYPAKEVEPEIVYEQISLNTLQCDYVDYYFYGGANRAKDLYLNKYVEFNMTDYYESWVKAVGDDFLFNAILTEEWSYAGDTPTDVSYTYLQIKFTSMEDVEKILETDLFWDNVIVRGQIIAFTENGILIKGLEVITTQQSDIFTNSKIVYNDTNLKITIFN